MPDTPRPADVPDYDPAVGRTNPMTAPPPEWLDEPEPTPRPADVPARHDRLAAAMLTPLIDHGLREAVKWVMEPELLAMEAEIEKRVRARLADEFEASVERDGPIGDWDPYGEVVEQCLRFLRGGA